MVGSVLSLLSKEELIKRLKWRCPLLGHSKHNGLEHPNCYKKHSNLIAERIGFLDIESEDLKADYGIMFCYCIKDRDSSKIYSDIINIQDIKKYSSKDRNLQPKEDTRIISNLIRDLNHFDRIVTHFGSIFDLPFVRTRAVICGLDFPSYGVYVQTDNWRILKNKFKLSRNSQENASLKLLGATRKDHLSLSIKHGCLRGEKWALDLSLEHCKKDVLDLQDVYEKIHLFARQTKTSI